MPRSTTAPFSRRFTICHSAASETPEWANIMANGDSAHTQTRAEFFRTARTLTLAACATRLSPGVSRDRLSFTANMKEALSKADLVQENGPERPDFKIKLYADMDDATPVDSLIASSSSGITPSVMQSKCQHPERVVVGHPFNPPHIIPLVEVVGGIKTAPEAIQRAMAFYASIGKKPILLRKEIPG